MHTVDDVHSGHRLFVVRDDDKLGVFRKFLDDYKLTVSNIWLDFGYWLNVADVIGRL